MCPLRYLLIIASVLLALIVVLRGNDVPDYLDELETERKSQGKKWYETLWDFACGKYLFDLYQHYKDHQLKEAGDIVDDQVTKNDKKNITNDEIMESKKIS